ncbi:n-ethylmaleimide-sensitive fusion protein [Cystoisospora suis]|uniref:Vesicle-fusing ATPase n=1 Tax=Cystoisospora suis TaxID=483139 RepID=A0A2C6KXK5_9APIC|nr:n-ethylmaleimide-sensitive fusion protein [Cystoisospora suis]
MAVVLTAVKLPSKDVAFTNFAYVHPAVYTALRQNAALAGATLEGGGVLCEVKNIVVSVMYALGLGQKTLLAIAIWTAVLTALPDGLLQKNEIGLNTCHRESAKIQLKDEVVLRPFELPVGKESLYQVGVMQVEVSTYLKPESRISLHDDKLEEEFKSLFCWQVFSQHQCVALRLDERQALKLTVKEMLPFDPSEQRQSATLMRGQLTEKSQVLFVGADDGRVCVQSRRVMQRNILPPDFNFEELGIGGLNKEFSVIFRRAFVSRIFPPSVIQEMGIKHVRGMLLYGPPGTGKTLIARQIGKSLRAREPVIVNGPEILNKYVGQSEENIRNLFKAAEDEYRRLGDNSSLHIIIFDEIDAICKQRGSSPSSAGVNDSIVNQLLSKIDGVEALNNILLIGMTNRRDLIDEALLRPGRLEVSCPFSYHCTGTLLSPTTVTLRAGNGWDSAVRPVHSLHIAHQALAGSLRLMTWQTRKFQTGIVPRRCTSRSVCPTRRDEYRSSTSTPGKCGKAAGSADCVQDVDLGLLATETENFSGAEIEGLVRSAASYAFQRNVNVSDITKPADIDNIKVTRSDFESALNEVKPAFGAEKELFDSRSLLRLAKLFTHPFLLEVTLNRLEQVQKELAEVAWCCLRNGVIPYGSHFDHLVQTCTTLARQVRDSEKTQVLSILLHGPHGCGKTALAAYIARGAQYPFMKLVTPDNFIGFSVRFLRPSPASSEGQEHLLVLLGLHVLCIAKATAPPDVLRREAARMNSLLRTFEDAYKSPLSLLVIDNIERLMDFTPIGPRFSNAVLQALLVLVEKTPAKDDRRLLIIATTSEFEFMKEAGVAKAFNVALQVPLVSGPDQIRTVLQAHCPDRHVFPPEEIDLVCASGAVRDVGIKKLLLAANMAKEFSAPGERTGLQMSAPVPYSPASSYNACGTAATTTVLTAHSSDLSAAAALRRTSRLVRPISAPGRA